MVYVPILKIDLPEPSLQELLPGLVHALIGTCTRVFDVVHDFLMPLTPEEEFSLYTAAVSHLPREFRLARKKILDNNIRDDDKLSEELEDAAYAYYRRQMRQQVAGYSDEDSEDVTFRRLMNPASATCDLRGEEAQQELQQLLQAQQAEVSRRAEAAAVAALPSRSRRVAVTTVAGGAGLALGAGVIKLAQALARLRRKAKPKQRRGPQAAGGRRPSDQGGRGSRQQQQQRGGAAAGKTTPRTTPRQR